MKKFTDILINKFGLNPEHLAGSSIDGTHRKDPYKIIVAEQSFSIDSAHYNLLTKNELRFSNSLIQICNMIHLARSLGTCSIFVPDYWYLPDGGFSTFDGIKVNSSKTYVSTGVTFEGAFFYLYSLRTICKDAPVNRFEILSKIRNFLNINFYEALEPNDLVIHIRAGDIFSSEKPHPGYGQPPFAFYEKVISSQDWAKIYVVCEDFSNPVTSLIENYCNINKIPLFFISGDLKSDVEFLLRARNLVAGRGTFIPGVVALSKNVRNVYFFESLFSAWGNNQANVIKVKDITSEYSKTILANNWNNSSEQLDLMRNYPVSKVDFA